jgi:hypothetical protein
LFSAPTAGVLAAVAAVIIAHELKRNASIVYALLVGAAYLVATYLISYFASPLSQFLWSLVSYTVAAVSLFFLKPLSARGERFITILIALVTALFVINGLLKVVTPVASETMRIATTANKQITEQLAVIQRKQAELEMAIQSLVEMDRKIIEALEDQPMSSREESYKKQ